MRHNNYKIKNETKVTEVHSLKSCKCQHRYNYFNCFIMIVVRFLFNALLQIVASFNGLHACSSGLVAAVVPRWVGFVHLRTRLSVNANHDDCCTTVVTHVLGAYETDSSIAVFHK